MSTSQETSSESSNQKIDRASDENKRITVRKLVCDISSSELRIIVLSLIIMVPLRLESFSTLGFSVVVPFFVEMLPIVLLLMGSGTAIVGLVAFVNNRIILSHEKKERRDRAIDRIDFIVSSVLASVAIFFLPNILNWSSKISLGFQADIPIQVPEQPIYGLSQILAFISHYLIFEVVIIISIVLLYQAIFYRFATRIVMFLDAENVFTWTYTDRSGKSFLYAIGLMIGYAFVARDVFNSDILFLYLLAFTLPFALGQRFRAKYTLETIKEDKDETLKTPLDRFTKWYSFATKRVYRWLILIGIFISICTFLDNLVFQTWWRYQEQWQLLGYSAIAAVGFMTLYFLIRYFTVSFHHQNMAIGKRARIESAADLIISVMVFVVALIVFLPEIGLNQWIGMQRFLMELFNYSFVPQYQFQCLITATLWQAYMILLLLALVMRVLAVSRKFMDRHYENERRDCKLLGLSGKVLIIAIVFLFTVRLELTRSLYFGFLTETQAFLLLTVIITLTVLSQLRVREIDLMEEKIK